MHYRVSSKLTVYRGTPATSFYRGEQWNYVYSVRWICPIWWMLVTLNIVI